MKNNIIEVLFSLVFVQLYEGINEPCLSPLLMLSNNTLGAYIFFRSKKNIVQKAKPIISN